MNTDNPRYVGADEEDFEIVARVSKREVAETLDAIQVNLRDAKRNEYLYLDAVSVPLPALLRFCARRLRS